MQGLVQFNGEFGCNWCEHQGQHTREHGRVYPQRNPLPKERTHGESVLNMMLAVELRNIYPEATVDGFKESSQLLLLDHFNIVTGFVPDYLHAMLLGIPRQFGKIWFTSNNINCTLKNREAVLDGKNITHETFTNSSTFVTSNIKKERLECSRVGKLDTIL